MEVIIIERQVFDALVLRVKTIEEKAELLCRRYDDLGLKRWLDNQEVCEAHIAGVPKQRSVAF